MKTNRMLLTAATAMGLGLLTSVALQAGVTGTPHQFAGAGSSATWNTTDELCKPCHIPHASQSAVGTLWNHAYQDGTAYEAYDEDAVLGPQSLKCLGCHDGQTALDAFSASPGGSRAGTPGNVMTGDAVIGTDLTDDHPVGVPYPVSTRFAAIGTGFGGGAGIKVGTATLPLYGEGVDNKQIECTTCHTPHDNSKGDFLRVKNNDPANPSGLCVGCHTSWK